ncbi:MAG: hypothetical protein JWO60_1037 [Frankiales bacterium]|nr:hypothetical protein [Frankiales bacterium]
MALRPRAADPRRTAVASLLLLAVLGTAGAVYGAAPRSPHDAVVALPAGSVTAAALASGAGTGAVPGARCGPGSRPETGLQGEVPAADRASGRSLQPSTCNLQQVAPLLGDAAGLQAAYYGTCAYYGSLTAPLGVRVVDVRDSRRPRITTTLRSPAMLDPWESLKVHRGRGLLAAVEGTLDGPAFFDVYDVKTDCTRPRLLASVPMNLLGHEGEWSQDGKTYYATAFAPGVLTAIDVTDPTLPLRIASATIGATAHGLSTDASGNRLYAVEPGTGNGQRNGLLVLDVSQIQARATAPTVRVVGSTYWTDGAGAQHTIPVSYRGKPFVWFVDESDNGGTRLIDISDERRPRVVTKIRSEIQLPQHAARAAQEGGQFGYNSHYCNVDRARDPEILACSQRASGVRVYDVRDPLTPREIAYYNAGGTEGGDGSGEMSAQVHLDRAKGQLWTTDYGKGLIITRFTNGVWPRKP